MKILYVVGDASFRMSDNAGYTRHILTCVDALKSMGHEVRLIAPDSGMAQGKETFGRTKKFIPSCLRPLVKDIGKIAFDSRLRRRIDSEIASFKPDVIYNRLALFHVSGIAAGKAAKVPTVLEVNARLITEVQKYFGIGLKSIAASSELWVYKEASAIVVVSTQLKEELVQAGVPADKIYVNPNGVDIEEFSPSINASPILKKYNLEGKRVVGFLGSLAPWHGVQNLLQAARIVCAQRPDARFLIVGAGDEYESLVVKASEYGISDKIVLTGSVKFDQVPVCVNAMDIATAPYPMIDNFYFSPIKLFEYMAAGRAIVGSNLGQIGEIVRDGENGVLVEAGNVEELAEKLIYLIDQPDLCKELGDQARRDAVAEYTWVHNAERIAAVCRRLLGNGK